MQRISLTWLGLATIGMVGLGCPAEPGDDEVGEGTDTDSTSGSTTDETTSSDTTDATDATDSTDTATDTTETTGDGDFTVIEAAFADDFATLVLTFNDAVGPVDTVDPADFRISMAVTYAYTYMGVTYELSTYYDPNYYVDYMAEPIGMMAIANGPNPDQISLTLAPIFDAGACVALEQLLAEAPPEAMAEGQFFPHYSPGGVPVTSEAGVELAAIGPDWVVTPDNYFELEQHGWPNLDPQVPIPCP